MSNNDQIADVPNPSTVSSSTNGSVTKFEKSLEQITASAHQGIDRLSVATHPAVDRLASGAHATVDTLNGVATKTVEKIDTNARLLTDMHARTIDVCRSHVRDTPLVAVGVSLAAGYLLARIVGVGAR